MKTRVDNAATRLEKAYHSSERLGDKLENAANAVMDLAYNGERNRKLIKLAARRVARNNDAEGLDKQDWLDGIDEGLDYMGLS